LKTKTKKAKPRIQ